jgi:riboflavin kinase / FMN adenylyltransferase
MQVAHKLGDIPSDLSATSVAIGNFDGCHLGHLRLLKAMGENAKKLGILSAVLTFFPHPVEVLNPGSPLLRLMTASEKLAFLEQLGIDFVLVAPFTNELRALHPEAFFKTYLVEGLRAKSIHVGTNFRFGHGRIGTTETLQELSQKTGIDLDVVPTFVVGDVKVSSSTIRTFIAQGKTLEAKELLGRPYSLLGQVFHGDHRGQMLGFPTANLHCPDDKLLPENGVYVTRSIWQKQMFRSVANIGFRPTFPGDLAVRPRVEVHVLDFNTRLYDEFIEVEFFEKIRSEMKFPSIEALKEQIARDAVAARTSKSFHH